VALITATVAATFTAAALPRSIDLIPASRFPRSPARARARFRTGSGGCSSPAASERRARKMSVSTADCDRFSSSAISWYESPCHSRSRIARRWFSGIVSRTSCSPISSSERRDGAGATSSTRSKSAGDSMRPRRHDERRLDRQTLCAILNSHAASISGTTPRFNPRNAFRNVLWTASSASSREPSWCRQ
jgi:hypothetical protein